MSDHWVERALETPRAFGDVPGTGVIRAQPEDFFVEEDLGFAPAGAGPHVLLQVRKRSANGFELVGKNHRIDFEEDTFGVESRFPKTPQRILRFQRFFVTLEVTRICSIQYLEEKLLH